MEELVHFLLQFDIVTAPQEALLTTVGLGLKPDRQYRCAPNVYQVLEACNCTLELTEHFITKKEDDWFYECISFVCQQIKNYLSESDFEQRLIQFCHSEIDSPHGDVRCNKCWCFVTVVCQDRLAVIIAKAMSTVS